MERWGRPCLSLSLLRPGTPLLASLSGDAAPPPGKAEALSCWGTSDSSAVPRVLRLPVLPFSVSGIGFQIWSAQSPWEGGAGTSQTLPPKPPCLAKQWAGQGTWAGGTRPPAQCQAQLSRPHPLAGPGRVVQAGPLSWVWALAGPAAWASSSHGPRLLAPGPWPELGGPAGNCSGAQEGPGAPEHTFPAAAQQCLGSQPPSIPLGHMVLVWRVAMHGGLCGDLGGQCTRTPSTRIAVPGRAGGQAGPEGRLGGALAPSSSPTCLSRACIKAPCTPGLGRAGPRTSGWHCRAAPGVARPLLQASVSPLL